MLAGPRKDDLYERIGEIAVSIARLEESVSHLREISAAQMADVRKDIERIKKFSIAAVVLVAATGGHENISKIITFLVG